MSEEKLLKTLAKTVNSLPDETVDLTAGVMKSINQKLNTQKADQYEIERDSFNVLYWTCGISAVVAIIFFVSMSYLVSGFQCSLDCSLLKLLVNS